MCPQPEQPDPQQRRAEIAAEIAALGPALPGSLVQRYQRCGRRDCACRADPPQRHGPYPAWTRKVAGTTVTRSLSPQQAERYQPWFDNARRLRELLAELHQLAIDQLDTTEDQPGT